VVSFIAWPSGIVYCLVSDNFSSNPPVVVDYLSTIAISHSL